jgi:hypothetical protein
LPRSRSERFGPDDVAETVHPDDFNPVARQFTIRNSQLHAFPEAEAVRPVDFGWLALNSQFTIRNSQLHAFLKLKPSERLSLASCSSLTTDH